MTSGGKGEVNLGDLIGEKGGALALGQLILDERGTRWLPAR